MTDLEENVTNKIDGFISGMSSVNLVFALAMNLFNFTILVLLKQSGIPVFYGGLGISIGQGILLFAVIPLGRMIDRGRAFALMAAGSVLYGAVIILIFVLSGNTTIAFAAAVTVLIALVLVFQNMFKSSLSSFIAKAVRAKLIGKSYSRIIWMEAAGGTLAFFVAYVAGSYFPLRLIYVVVGAIVLVTSVLSFTILAGENRRSLRLEASRVVRPSFVESIRTLRNRGKFTIALLSSKVFMSVGVLGFSYFYILIGTHIGVSDTFSLAILGVASAIGIAWGILSERFVSRHPDWGKAYVVIMALLDVVAYGLMLISLHGGSVYFFILAPIIGSPGPFLIPGALAYEVRVVGRENRGIFAGIQRTFTGIPAIALGAPLTYLFTVSPFYMWSIVVASSVATLATSLMIPSRKYLEDNYGIGDSTTLQ